MSDIQETPREEGKFDFSAFPPDTLFHERRYGRDRRTDAAQPQPQGPILAPGTASEAPPPRERRQKVERRKRIDPTTFEKQYTDDELEFMNAMQRFKVQSGKSFPSHGEVLRVALALGYRRVIRADDEFEMGEDEPVEVAAEM